MSEASIPGYEAPYEQHLTELSIEAAKVLSEHDVPSTTQPDGSVTRDVYTPLTSSRSPFAGLTEVTPADGGAISYTYRFVTYDTPINTQLLSWQNNKPTITHSVRFTAFPEDEPQFVKDIEPSEPNVSDLKERIRYLGTNLNKPTKLANPEAKSRPNILRRILGRLAAGNAHPIS